MIQTNALPDGVHCVVASAEDKDYDLEIRIHWHQPGVNLLGFQVFAAGEFVAGIGAMGHES